MRKIGADDLSAPRRSPGGGKPAFSAATECPICGGAGYLRKDVSVGHPDFGRPIACECRMREEEERRLEEQRPLSNLDAFKRLTFHTFDKNVPGVKEAFAFAWEFAKDPQGWILFRGDYGCGKTHLAAAIAHEAFARGIQVIFAVVPDLLDHLRAAYAPTSGVEYDYLFERIRNAPLLILDDLGTENTTPWAEEKLYQIINYRYNNEMPTIITTNQDRIDGRILSRICDRRLCRDFSIQAGDYRRRTGERRFKEPASKPLRRR